MSSLFSFFAQQDGSNKNIIFMCFGAAVNAVTAQFIPCCPKCIIFITVTELPQIISKIFN